MLSPANPEESGGGRFLGGGRDGEALVVPNIPCSKRAEGPLLLLVILRAAPISSSSLLTSRGRRLIEVDTFSGRDRSSEGTMDWLGMSVCSCFGSVGSDCVIAMAKGCKSGSAKGCGGGGDLIGICDGGGLSAAARG